MSQYKLMQLQEALNAYPHQDKSSTTAAKEWLELFAYPDWVKPNEAVIDPKGNFLSIAARNANEEFAPQFRNFLAANQYPDMETRHFWRALEKFPNALFAAEMDLIGENRDIRWVALGNFLPSKGQFLIGNAMFLIPEGSPKNILKDWYRLVDSNECLGFGRSVGGDYTYWKTVLMGDTTPECINTYLYLAKKWSVEALPKMILEMIAVDNPQQLDLTAHITKTGVTKMGISIDNPSDKLIRLAIEAMGNENSPSTVGTFESALNVVKACRVEFSVSAAGFQSRLFYQF